MKKDWLLETSLALKAISEAVDLFEKKGALAHIAKIKQSPRDIVTDLDVLIEERIKQILRPSGYEIIGEEGYRNKKINIGNKRPIWFIDPIDGTTNLISSIPYYATSVGLVSEFRFVAGAVAIPSQKEIFFTIDSEGAFMNGVRLQVKSADLKNSLIAIGFSGSGYKPNLRNKEFECFGMLNDLSRGCLRLGSASTNICFVAAGRLQATYGIFNKIWDIAGALAIALQAGYHGYIEQLDNSVNISYAVGAPGVIEEIVEFLRKKRLAYLKTIRN